MVLLESGSIINCVLRSLIALVTTHTQDVGKAIHVNVDAMLLIYLISKCHTQFVVHNISVGMTDNQKILVRIPLTPSRYLDNFVYPTLPVSFG